ncbi:MAG: glycoside hydrolase family 31 protein [Kiritimatiellia bacterium]
MTEKPQAEKHGPVVTAGNARFTVITPQCVRMEYHPRRQFVDSPSLFAADRETGFEDFTLRRDENKSNRFYIDTGRLALGFTDDGLPFCRDNTECSFTNGKAGIVWRPCDVNTRNLGGTISSLDGCSGPVHLGEGLLSRDGWYLLDDSGKHVLEDGWIKPRSPEDGIDWYLFAYGTDYLGALKSLAAIGGRIPIPRRYVFGSWYSRWHPYTSNDYREIVDEYDRENYPLDVLVFDMDWHRKDAADGIGWASTKGWTGFSWNRELLPDAEDLIAELRGRGVSVTLNVHPHDGIRAHEDRYGEFAKDLGLAPDSAETPLFDAGDRKYMEAYFRHGHEPHETAGVAFWWVDWQQDVCIPHARSVPGLKHLPWLNELYFRHTKRGGLRGQSFSRWGGWGDHRHPIHFSGDTSSGWPILAFEVPFTATASNVGCFYWSHDLGGFCGEVDPETYSRWLQFGAFSACMRLHGVGADRRPWKWPEWTAGSMRRSFRLRSRLMPYTYSCAARSCRETLPLIRSTYLDYPEDEEAYRNPQQYFYGDGFLAAPVVSAGRGPGRVASQVVYFPAGTWYNWFTGERFRGPREVLVSAALDEFPLYIKAGLPVPMQEFTTRMTAGSPENLTVRVFPPEEGQKETFTLYEDDGITASFEKHLFAETGLSCARRGNSMILRIGASRGSYEGIPSARRWRLELPSTLAADSVSVNGRPAKSAYDSESMTNTVEIDKTPVSAELEIEIKARPADPDKAAKKARLARARGILGKEPEADIPRTAARIRKEDDGAAQSLLAAGGMGFFEKDESLWGNGTAKLLKFYAPEGVTDGDGVRFSAELRGKGPGAVEMDFRNVKAFPVPVPRLPVFDRQQHPRIQAEFSVNGQKLSCTADMS